MRKFTMLIRQKYKKLSLERKFSLLSMMVIFFVMVSFVLTIRIFYEKSVIEIATTGYAEKFGAVSKSCMDLFVGAEQLSKVLCTDEDIQNWFEYDKRNGMPEYIGRIMRAESRLDYVDALYPDDRFSSISIFTAEGEMLNTNNIRAEKEVYQAFFEAIKEQTDKTRWIDLYELQIAGYRGSGIAFVRPYRNYTTGQVKGYVMVEYDADILIHNFAELRYGQEGQYLIADEAGHIKIDSGRKADYSIAGEEFFQYAIGARDKGSIYPYKHENYLVTVARIPTIDWIMIGLTPVRVLTQRGDIIIRMVYLIGLLAMLLSAVFNSYIAHSVTKPLSLLANTMERFGQGNLEERVSVDTEDEAGRLSSHFNDMAEQIEHLIVEVYREQREKRKYEISALQAQMNPHFLYNTLNSVCALIQGNKPDDAYTMIYAIGQFYRTALSDGNILIPIAEEILNIQNYIQIQSMRYGAKITYDMQIEKRIEAFYTVKLTLQPLVENAIYHGIKELSGKGTIEIKGWLEGSAIYFEVIDNGVGMEQARADEILSGSVREQQTSFGLFSIHERIQLYFGKQYGLKLLSSPGKGMRATVSIPVTEQKEREELQC